MKNVKPIREQMKARGLDIGGVGSGDVSPKLLEPLEMFACPDCGRLHSETYEADRCCEKDVEQFYVCQLCDEKDRRCEYDKGVFSNEDLVRRHIKKEHHAAPIPGLHDQYMELLIQGRAPIAEWVMTEYAHVEDPEVRDRLIYLKP